MKNVLVVVTLVAFASLFASAQSPRANGSEKVISTLPAFSSHVLKKTYVSAGGGFSVGGGFTNIDSPNTVSCPGTSGKCLIQADTWVQLGAETFTANRVATCVTVDGVYQDNTCFYQGETLTDGDYAQFSQSSATTVSFGNHTVQTQVYTDDGAFLPNYNINYRVYKP